VQYDPTPTPDVGRTARVPDGDRMLYAVGSTWKATDSIQWDAAVSYISFDDTKINRTETIYAGTAAATTLNLQGRRRRFGRGPVDGPALELLGFDVS
jgi:long-chain fatty acid transport protein